MWQASVQSKSIKQEQSPESGWEAFKNVCMWQEGPRSGLLHRTWQVKKATWNNSSFQPPFPLFSCQIQSPRLAADAARTSCHTVKFLVALRKSLISSAQHYAHLYTRSFCVQGGCIWILTRLLNTVCAVFITHVQFGTEQNKSCDLPSHASGFQCCLQSPQSLQNRLLLPQCSYTPGSIINT